MAFREIRNFCETLKVLGYPRNVSMDKFKKPDFLFTADIMKWLINRLDPSTEIPMAVHTEQDRVTFVKTCIQLISGKASISLDPTKIYSADYKAVQELNKLASLLYQAAKTSENIGSNQTEESILNEEFVMSKTNQLKKARQLASKITQKGAILSDLLEKEIELGVTMTKEVLPFADESFLKEKRSNVLDGPSEIQALEKALQEEIKLVEKEIENINFKIEKVASDETNLDEKIDKKRQELERYSKRLQALMSVRPPYMDEYEKYEEEMVSLYQDYVVKYRNMVYLDQQLESYEKIELENMMAREEQVKKTIEQIKDEEALRLDDDSGKDFDGGVNLNGFDDDDDDDDNEGLGSKAGLQLGDRPRRSLMNISTASGRNSDGNPKIFGDVFDDDKDNSLDSDLSLGPDEDQSELDSDDERELMKINDKNQQNSKDQHDDDF